ncbi:MAG: lamin tail domain-containing protein, partial [Bacteroidota bacterium]|nr:lamin tail domain-containing protein [Bacteroidota bacterium]
IVISEIMYNPPESGQDSLEFIELYNNDTAAINLHNYYFSNGIQYTFPVYNILPQSYLLICKDSLAMLNTFGVHARQWTSGDLSNAGELLLLRDYNGFTVDSVLYDDTYPWDSLPDGRGPSLELCDPTVNNSYAYTWRHALEFAAVNVMGDTIWASPGTGCTNPPDAGFYANNTRILAGDLVIFTDSTSGPVTSWEWTFDGGVPSTWSDKTPPPVQYNTEGVYDVRLTAKNIAGKTTEIKTGYITVGPVSAGDLQNSGISLYPDPSNGIFTIRLDQKALVCIRIINQLGTVICQKTVKDGKAGFDLTSFPKGMYFAEIQNFQNGRNIMKKFIIQ